MGNKNRVSRHGLLVIDGAGSDGGGRGKRLHAGFVQMTLRVPLGYRNHIKRWALDRNLTMSELVVMELKPPDRTP
jgi:hypothetical protein